MLGQLFWITLAACGLAVLNKADLPDSGKLKEAFNAASGKVRIVMLVSPTCPGCVSGADVIRSEIVGKLKDKRLGAFCIFIPMLASDGLKTAIEAATKMTEAGISSFSDENRSLGKAYGETVKLPYGQKTAWDVYFLYGPNALWDQSPPQPEFWMHQLAYDEQCLDPVKFRTAVEKQLNLIAMTSAGPKPKRSQPKIELLMFDGCPNSPKRKANLQTAMKALGLTRQFKVVDILKLPDGDVRKGYGAPSVLLAGRDLFGLREPKPGGAGACCRLYAGGIPSAADIETRLREFLSENRK